MAANYIPTNTQVPEISQSTNFTATAGLFYVVSGSSPVTATLPTAVGHAGTVVRIRCVTGFTGLCTIATVSAQTLGPTSATSQILYAGETALVQSDGFNWVRTGGLLIPCLAKMTVGLVSSISIANNTDTLVGLDTTAFDNTGQMTHTFNNTLSIFRPGYYDVAAKAFWAGASGLAYDLYTLVNKNGSTQVSYDQMAFGANGFTNFSQTLLTETILLLAAGDVLTMHVYQANSGSGNVSLNGNNVTFLSVKEIPSW